MDTKHPLQAYREAHGLTRQQLATEIGTSDVSVYRIEKGQQRPSYSMMQRIHEVTKGAVTANDLVLTNEGSAA